jgi:SAM-dependent methyltransferase
MSLSPTERFSDRVDAYTRYRPTYPPQILELVARELGLEPGIAVADVGSGTGIWTELWLDWGARVLGVEPNAAMRAEAERRLGSSDRFTSISGSAEDTTLPDASVDVVTAAQAFHWFDRESARGEFSRILRPRGWVTLLWNSRRVTGDFLEAYEQLLCDFSDDYAKVDHRQAERDVESFFASGFGCASVPNHQDLDYEGLEGRLRSTSYAPPPDDARFSSMITRLRALFDRHAEHGVVRIAYDVKIFWGRL